MNVNQLAKASNAGHPPDEPAPALRAVQQAALGVRGVQHADHRAHRRPAAAHHGVRCATSPTRPQVGRVDALLPHWCDHVHCASGGLHELQLLAAGVCIGSSIWARASAPPARTAGRARSLPTGRSRRGRRWRAWPLCAPSAAPKPRLLGDRVLAAVEADEGPLGADDLLAAVAAEGVVRTEHGLGRTRIGPVRPAAETLITVQLPTATPHRQSPTPGDSRLAFTAKEQAHGRVV